ncbi:MAG: hypothetical protein ABL901_02830 [Hyphomicrobiaceae bacterium]|nr:hypothetical protein [Hyphomicrobiaceae bacterium]
MTSLTNDERIFFSRCIDHMTRNPSASLIDAAKAVRERDEQLWLLAMAKTPEGAAIREALAERVYAQIGSVQ